MASESCTLTCRVEIYNPASGTFSLGSEVNAHAGAAIATLANGSVLVVGGQDSSGNLAIAEVFDPVSQMFTAAGAMVRPRVGAQATTLADGVTAQTQVTIVSESTVVTGESLWKMSSGRALPVKQVVRATPSVNGPDLYLISGDPLSTFVQAVGLDGRQLWQASVPMDQTLDVHTGSLA